MAPSGQTWVVTGASRGLGLEHVKQFLQQGFHVIAAARSPSKSEALSKLQKQHPDHIFLVSLDTTNDASVHAGFCKHIHGCVSLCMHDCEAHACACAYACSACCSGSGCLVLQAAADVIAKQFSDGIGGLLHGCICMSGTLCLGPD